ncbi:MAG: hypothetical protein ABII00_03000, partial [Elusimicrobiota bacterium]
MPAIPALLLGLLLAAPQAGAASEAGASRVAPPRELPVEAELEDRVRRDRNAVRRAQRAFKRAREKGDAEAARTAELRLEQVKAASRVSRDQLRAAVERGEVSPGYGELKRSVRSQLNAVRRARYSLKRAQRMSDSKGTLRARDRSREAKRVLKRQRMRMRRFLRRQGPPHPDDDANPEGAGHGSPAGSPHPDADAVTEGAGHGSPAGSPHPDADAV